MSNVIELVVGCLGICGAVLMFVALGVALGEDSNPLWIREAVLHLVLFLILIAVAFK